VRGEAGFINELRLFEAERLDGIEPGSLPRRIETEEYPHRAGEQSGDRDGLRWNRHRPLQQFAQQQRPAHTDRYTHESAKQAEQQRLAEELRLYAAFRGADSHADTDLARALRDRDQHHVHDPDAADEQGYAGDRDQQYGESPARFQAGLDELVGTPDVEVVVLSGPDMVTLAQQADDLVDGRIHRLLRGGRGHDVVKPVVSLQLLHSHGVGEDEGIVLVLAESGLTFGFQDSYHLAWIVVDADHLADGIFGGEKQTKHSYKILDTSVIIDGRIADIAETGFLDGVLIIPQFVLRELQLVADSADSLKRNRGRRGLDILQRVQKIATLNIQIVETDYPSVREVDLKLIELAKEMEGKIVTNDFNLNKVAQLQGVEVLNINELANSLKPIVLPGEAMRVFILKEGKEYNQGVAYLDDGTMVVVDNARKLIGKTIDIAVTSVLQTTAGKMIFGKYDERTRPDMLRPTANLKPGLPQPTQPASATSTAAAVAPDHPNEQHV